MKTTDLVEHFFRHEYGRLVAVLSCRVGVAFLADVEDAAQSALLSALECWTIQGVPENPSAWLFQTARHSLLGELRKDTRRRHLLHQNVATDAWIEPSEGFLPNEVEDSLLRMLFVCCDDRLPIESQLVLALKTLCGFDVREIALRLFTSEANVYKRLTRARQRLHNGNAELQDLSAPAYNARLPAVRQVLYLLFTEGYLSSHAQFALRRELCEESLRLTRILATHQIDGSPETCALMALLHLHMARLAARQDGAGGLLLLEEQDRSQWNHAHIAEGLCWLSRSASGDNFSRFHAEAGIAAEHCLAPSFPETRWDRVADNYWLLEQSTHAPIHRLNRAVAIAEGCGAAAGLAVLDNFDPPVWLANSYMWSAVLADLHRRHGDREQAQKYGQIAWKTAPTPHIQQLLQRRLALEFD